MKKITLMSLLVLSCFTSVASQANTSELRCPDELVTYIDRSEGGPGAICSEPPATDIRSEESFVATCPEEFLTYIDQSEGGPGAYCACPDENISYLDKSEGGPGAICVK